MSQRKTTRDAFEILKRRFGVDPESDPEVQRFTEGIEVAEMLFAAREAAGLTQKQLAELTGTTPEVISQLEDADYEGDCLSMLHRIAKALHSRVEIRIVPCEFSATEQPLQTPNS